jgi:hypothetical protein
MSCAILEAGDWKYHAIAFALPAASAAHAPPMIAASLLPFMYRFP